MTRAAILFPGAETLSIENVSIPELGPSDVRIEVQSSGVCGTDLRTLASSKAMIGAPLVLGHEVAGVVTQIGESVQRVQLGETVIASFSSSCGHCWFCIRNETHLCAHYQETRNVRRVTLGEGRSALLAAGVGAFAEEIVVHDSTVVAVPPAIPFEQMCLIGCSVATGVGSVTRAAQVTPGASVAVIGCGGVGHFVIQGCRMVGAERIIAVDSSEAKREAALRVGATDAIDPAATDAIDAIREMTSGRGVDFAFEVVGRAETLQLAYASTRRGGTVTAVGFPPEGSVFQLDAASVFRDAKKLVGSYYGNVRFREDFPSLVALAHAGRLTIGTAVSERFSLEHVNEAIDVLRGGTVVRTVLHMK